MTKWTMVADLRRCVGCQTCTAACKHANATAPAVQWRRVLDIETGDFPNVGRTFVPVGCMHCEDPPCMHVCPSTATGQRADGIVTIDYDICIGCAYCAVACPYQARYTVMAPRFAYGSEGSMRNEAAREDPARIGVAQKCTFCADRIDFGLENGLTPGIAPEATPACVNSCIADALHFGDADDPDSNVSALLAENASFRMHAELGTEPNFHYIWATATQAAAEPEAQTQEPALPARGVGGVGAAAPWLQQHWDWRAAANFIGGGTGSGLMITAAVSTFMGGGSALWPLVALGLVGLGLLAVFAETGRPLRAPLNVFFHPQTSWMTREAMAGVPLFALGIAAAFTTSQPILGAAAAVALVYLYCQARILTEAKGIPAWRHPALQPVMMLTGLVEGLAIYLFVGIQSGPVSPTMMGAMIVLLLARAWAWDRYHRGLVGAAPAETLKVFDRFDVLFQYVGNLGVAILFGIALWETDDTMLISVAGPAALLSGWAFKYVLITRAAYNQGFHLERTPEKGGGAGPGAQPGWN